MYFHNFFDKMISKSLCSFLVNTSISKDGGLGVMPTPFNWETCYNTILFLGSIYATVTLDLSTFICLCKIRITPRTCDLHSGVSQPCQSNLFFFKLMFYLKVAKKGARVEGRRMMKPCTGLCFAIVAKKLI